MHPTANQLKQRACKQAEFFVGFEHLFESFEMLIWILHEYCDLVYLFQFRLADLVKLARMQMIG